MVEHSCQLLTDSLIQKIKKPKKNAMKTCYFFLIFLFIFSVSQLKADMPLTKKDMEILTREMEKINKGKLIPEIKSSCWDIDAKSEDGDCLKRLDGDDLEFFERIRLEVASNLDKTLSGDLDLSDFIKSTAEADIAALPTEKQSMVRLILAHHQAELMETKYEDLKFKYLKAIYLGNEDGLYGELQTFADTYNAMFATGEDDKIHPEQLKAKFYSQLQPYLFLKKDEGKGVTFDEHGKPSISAEYFKESLDVNGANPKKAKLGREVLFRLYPNKMSKLAFDVNDSGKVERDVIEVAGLVLSNDQIALDKRSGNWDALRVIDTKEEYSKKIQSFYFDFHQKMEEVQRASNKMNSLLSRMKEVGKGSLVQYGKYLTYPKRLTNKIEVSRVEELKNIFPQSKEVDVALEVQKAEVAADEQMIETMEDWAESNKAKDEFDLASDALSLSMKNILDYSSTKEESKVIQDQYHEFLDKLNNETDESLKKTKWTTYGMIAGAALLPVMAVPALTGGTAAAATTSATAATGTAVATGTMSYLNIAVVATPFLAGMMKTTIDKIYRNEDFFCSAAKHLPQALGDAGFSLGTLGIASGVGQIFKAAASQGAAGLGKIPSIMKLGESLKSFGDIAAVTKANKIIKIGLGTTVRGYIPFKSVKSTITSYLSAKEYEEQAAKELILPSGGQASYEASIDEKENAVNGLIGFLRSSVALGEGFYGVHDKAATESGKDFANSLSDYLEKGAGGNIDNVVKAATKEVVEGAVIDEKSVKDLAKDTLKAATNATAAGKVVDIIKKEEVKTEEVPTEELQFPNIIEPVKPGQELK